MTPERWKQVEEIFQSALDLAPGARADFIAGACAGDEELRAQVEALVAQFEEAGDFIEEPAVAATGLRAAVNPADTTPMTGTGFDDPSLGRRIGNYRIVREIGRGGMGAVYLAERADSAFRRSVAIKLIKRGMDTDFILRRFRNERQILATLDHPYIARLLDGGTTDDGLPYFVMEFIEGSPVYRFCDERKLTINERLRLFRHVCDAVHYAHRQLVIHRDIKPSNILVTPDGTPKLLDFGIAKLLNPELAAEITLDPTATAMRLMTPEYAAPEQVRGEPVTPATDVYALGVLLYELLTGHRPYRLRHRSPHEMARVVCDEMPVTPSARVTSPEDLLPAHPSAGDPDTLDYLYWSRGATAETLRRELAGALDRVVMKALRKEPLERYRSAEELREDITRHLDGRPVSAPPVAAPPPGLPPPGRARVAGPEPLTDEHSIAILPLKVLDARGADTGGDYLGVGLADALITRLGSLRRFALRPTSSVIRFGGADTDPFAAGRELGVGFVLEGRIRRAGDRIRVNVQLLDVGAGSTVWAGQFDQKFTDVLQLEDAISERVAEALLPQLTGGERLRLQKRGTDHPEAHEAYMRGRYHWNSFTEEGLARALTHYHEAVALDPDYALAHAGIADYYNWLGVYAVLPFAETSAAAKESALKAVGLDDSLAEAHSALGFARLTHDFEWGLSEDDHRRALELNPNYATGRVWYAFQLMMEGRFEEALAEARRALELDPLSAINVHTLTWCHYNWRRFDECVPLARRLVALEPTNGIGHLFLGHLLAMTGEREESLAESLKAAEIFGRSPYALSWLAMNYGRTGRHDEARSLLAEIEAAAEHRYVSPYLLALAYCNLGERTRTLELLERALEERDSWLVWMGVEPQLDPVRADPRFAEILRRTNNPAAARHAPTVASAGAHAAPAQKSVAVLPLRLINPSHSSGTGDDYLGVGLADALVTRLSNIRQIVVRPTSSVLRYQGLDVDPLAAGRELEADYVVTGAVRVAGERIRVSAQLLDVRSGATRWAGKFDEGAADVLQLEDSISEQVAGAIIPHLTGDERRQLEKRGTDNAEAFEAYLRGRYHWNTFTTEGYSKSLFFYRRAISIDPDYALAHAGVADYHLWHSIFGYGSATPAESAAVARESALRALELDEELAEAHATLCVISLIHDYDRDEAERHERRSLELNPRSGMAYVWRSTRLMMEGRSGESVAAARRALDLDPYTPFVQQHLGWTLYQARRFDESVAQYQRFVESEPRDGFVRCCLSHPLRQQKMYAEALSETRRAAELAGDSSFIQAGLGEALACAGLTREAREVSRRLRERARTQYVSPYHLAGLHVALGEHDEALAQLERAVEARDAWAVWLGTDPQLDSLREDPRFDELLRRMNVAAAQVRPRGAGAVSGTGERQTGGSRAGERSVAVLPLKVIGHAGTGDDTGDEYLGIGLADALVTRLSNVHRFVVRPTSSVLRYRGRDTDPLKAGHELGVEYIIDGHLRRVGGRIRVSALLLDVRAGTTRWAGQFDEGAADVLQLEDSISEQVAGAIIPRLTTEERRRLGKRGTDNAGAYDAYLRGRYHWNSFTEEGFAKALVCYNSAISIDPDYALAHAGVADYYNLLGVYSVLPFAETSAAAKESALKAAALDPALAEAYAALGFATLCQDFDWEGSERHMRRAIELNHNYPTAHLWYGYALGLAGRHDEAHAHMRRFLELDAHTPVGYNAIAWVHFYARRFEEAVTAARSLAEREPQYGMGQVFLCLALTQAGRHEEAVEAGRRTVELLGRSPYALTWLASACAAAGRRAEATALLNEIRQLSATRYVSPYLLAMVYCNLGDRARAVEELERALEVRDGRLIWLGVDPQFDPVRADPRVAELLRRTNNPLAPPRAPAPSYEPPTVAIDRRAATGDRTTGELGTTGAKSVAVLPLKVLGPAGGADKADEYLGVGLADALVTRLSSVQRLIVRPTSSVLRYQRGDADPLEAGRELNVDYVVDGNIRRLGDRIRVTAQLLDVREGATRWAGRFDKNSADVLQLEDSISELVAEALVPRLTGDERTQLEKRGTDNAEAYEAYLRGRFHWNVFTEEAFAQALEYYNRAISIDPSYALAHAAIADYYNFVGVLCIMPFNEATAAARASALRALELDPTLAEAYSALGLASVCYDFDWAASEANHRRSVELSPNNATGHQWYSFYLQMAGRFDEAIAEMRRAQEIDPLSSLITHSLAWCLYHARRLDESLAAYRALFKTVPNYPYGLVTYSEALRHVGRHDEAVAAAQRAVGLTNGAPFYLTFLAAALAAAGRDAEAREALRRLEVLSRSGRYVSPYMLAFVHVRLGERGRALDLLEMAYEITDGWLVWMAVDPELDPLRGDPRFDELLRRTKNPAAPKPVEETTATTGGRAVSPAAQDASARPRMTEDDEAQQLYVAGRYYATRRTAEGLRQAIERLERAVERDPRFALAHAELADCYALLNWYVEPPPADAWDQARLSAQRAVEADGELAEAHASLGFVKLHYERDWPGAEASLRRAIELKPDNPAARRWYAFSLAAMGRHDEAVAEIERARELSPRSPVIATAVANVLFLARRYEEAIEQCRRSLEIDPGSVAAHVVLRWSYERKGMAEEALATFEQERVFAGDTPTTRAKRAHVLAAIGRHEEAREILRDLLANRDEQRVTHYELAVICSLLDERDQALQFLAEAERDHAVGFTFVRVDPHLDNLRDDPRFVAMLERTGNLAPAAADPSAGPAASGGGPDGGDADERGKDEGDADDDDESGGGEPDDKSIAVLPFKLVNPVRSDDTGDDYLGVGLADALITRLSNVRQMTVRPTSAVVRFGADDTDPLEAGRALGVTHVLDGRVLRVGRERLRVTVQLVRVRDGAPVWADKFDQAGSDILDLQDSISEHVAAALVPRLTERERVRVRLVGTDDPRAYEAYLRGRYHMSSVSEDRLARAIECYREAIRLDPRFAAAHAGVADYFNWLGVYGVRPSAECFAEARAAADRAVALDPALAEAYAALNFAFVGLWDWQEAERLIRKAVELNPNYSTARNFYCLQLAAEGRFEEMEREGLRGLESDPLSPHLHQSIGWGLYHARRYEEALRHLDRSLELDPNFPMSRWVKGWALSEMGRHPEAVAELERAVVVTDRRSAPVLAGLAAVNARAGDSEGARRVLKEIEGMAAARHVSPYHFAVVHSVLGEEEQALLRLEEALAMREAWLIWLKGEPKFDPVRGHPRFRAVLERVHPAAPADGEG